MMEIDRDSAVPVYMQIAQKLKNDIEQGALSQGAKVPNETALGKRFLASRITVRKAVDILVQDGLLERKQGKGTYVVNSGVQVDFGTMQSFYGSLVRTGAHISTDLLHCQRIQAPRRLKLPAPTHCVPMALSSLTRRWEKVLGLQEREN